MQFGSIDPDQIPKKLRWFIICMQCECKCKGKSKHQENMEMMNKGLPARSPRTESDQITTTSRTKSQDNVSKSSKIEQSTSNNGSSVINSATTNSSATAKTLSTNAIRECNDETVIVFEN